MRDFVVQWRRPRWQSCGEPRAARAHASRDPAGRGSSRGHTDGAKGRGGGGAGSRARLPFCDELCALSVPVLTCGGAEERSSVLGLCRRVWRVDVVIGEAAVELI